MLPPGDVALSWDVELLWNVTWLVHVVPPWDVALSWHVTWRGAFGTVGGHSDVGARCHVPRCLAQPAITSPVQKEIANGRVTRRKSHKEY